jgi:hypothetical protein
MFNAQLVINRSTIQDEPLHRKRTDNDTVVAAIARAKPALLHFLPATTCARSGAGSAQA